MKSTIALHLCVLMLTSTIDASRQKRSYGPQVITGYLDPVELSVSPHIAAEGITPEVTIDCRLTEGVIDVQYVFYVALTHQPLNGSEEQVAELLSSELRTFYESNRTNAEAGVTEEGGSFLTVTIQEPIEEDSGTYRCKYIYLTNDFKAEQFLVAINVTVAVIPEAVERFIPPPVAPTGCECDAIWAEIGNLKATIVADNEKLKTQLDSYDDSCRVSFAYKIGAAAAIQDGKLVFDTAITNKGDAYSAATGDFVAPCDGMYHFGLSMRVAIMMSNGYVSAIIQHDGIDMARAAVFEPLMDNHYKSSSTEVAMYLTKGSKVNVVTDISGSISGHFMSDENTIFTGFFLHP